MKIRHNATLVGAALLALTLMPSIAGAQDYSAVQSNGILHLKGYGSFFRPRYTCRLPSPTVNARSYKQQHLLR